MDWKWTPRRRKAAELLAEGELTFLDVAKESGVSVRALYKWRRSTEFDEYVQELEEARKTEAKRYLHRRALRAAERVVGIMLGEDGNRTQLQAAIEVLNRSGVNATTQISLDNRGMPIIALLPAVGDGEKDLGSA